MRLLSASLLITCSVLATTASAQTTSGTSTPAQTPPTQSADDPRAAQPERPTVATHAGTVAPGYFELETGGEFDRYKDKTKGSLFPVYMKIGLASNLQLGLSAPIVRTPGDSNTGIGDASVALKWRLLEDAPILGDFAVLPTIKFATGSTDKGTGTGTTDGSLLLISSHKLGDVALDLNVGITRRSGDGTDVPKTSTVWTVSFGGPLSGDLGFAAEFFGFGKTTGPAGADPIVAFLVGPTWTVRNYLVLDAGIIAKITGDQPNAIYAGLTWNLGSIK